MIITYDGYIVPLLSREGLLYLEFIGKKTNDDLVNYPSVHLTSTHPCDPSMLDAPNPYHSLTTDGGEHGSPTGFSEGSRPKILSTRVPNGFFRSRYDQDPSAVKPIFEFDPIIDLMINFSQHQKRMGSRSPRQVTEFKPPT